MSQHIAADHLIMKKFAFQFVNRYCALFYVAFYAQDMVRLRSLLIFLLITNAVINNLLETFDIRMVVGMLKSLIGMKKDTPLSSDGCDGSGPPLADAAAVPPSSSGSAASASPPLEAVPVVDIHEAIDPSMSAAEKKRWRQAVAQTAELPTTDIGDDYLEMILQYGFCTMFAVAFPIAPALALINNVFESKIDFTKLLRSRRPTLHDRWCELLGFCIYVVN